MFSLSHIVRERFCCLRTIDAILLANAVDVPTSRWTRRLPPAKRAGPGLRCCGPSRLRTAKSPTAPPSLHISTHAIRTPTALSQFPTSISSQLLRLATTSSHCKSRTISSALLLALCRCKWRRAKQGPCWSFHLRSSSASSGRHKLFFLIIRMLMFGTSVCMLF